MTNEYLLISKKLQRLFRELPIDLAYLYGSRAGPKIDKFSDYDIGVVFDEKLSKEKRLDLQLQLFGDTADVFNVTTDLTDIVDVMTVPVLLQFNIISGKLIYCNNMIRKIAVESQIMANYHDHHYFLDFYLRETLKKIRKGVYFDRHIPYA